MPQDPYLKDLLARKPFSERLEKFINIENAFVEGGLILSLNAPFGSGKTTFIQMWADDINQRRETDTKLPLSIIINAWQSDHCGDPLIAIISSLSRALINDPHSDKKKAEKIRDGLKDVAWFGLGLANSFISSTTAVDAIAAASFSEQKRGEREYNILDNYEHRSKALEALKAQLEDALGGSRISAIIFIDELDRCRPDYAISYIETIKHIFSIQGVAFILAVDEKQLASAASALFGQGLNFPEYYRKFCHRSITLPLPSDEGTQRVVKSYLERYSGATAGRIPISGFSDYSVSIIIDLFSGSKITMRQAQEFFRILCHALSLENDQDIRVNHRYPMAVAYMVMIRTTNNKYYDKLGSGATDPKIITATLSDISLSSEDDKTEWFMTMTSCFPIASRNWIDISNAARDFNILKRIKTDSDWIKEAGNYRISRRNTDNTLIYIYNQIESIKRFGEE